MKKYQICVENIALAKSAGYPTRLMDKLNKRKADCLDQIRNSNDVVNSNQHQDEEPKLSLPPHPQIPFIVDCLEMKTSLEQGRHIVTNQDLKPGQIVAVEDAYLSSLHEAFNYRRCMHCLKDNMLSLIPCVSCTNSMFCSQTCLTAAEDFHEFECPISDFLMEFEQTRVVLRLVIRAIQSFDSIDDLMQLMLEPASVTTFSFDHNNELTAKQRYHQVHSLLTNEDQQSDMDMIFGSIYATLLYSKLLEHTSVKDMLSFDESEAARVALAELVHHSFLIVRQNCHMLLTFDAKKSENIGGGIYPFASLINHSCSPNIFRISSGTRNVFVVLRVIKKGEQLVDCYR